MIIIIIIYNFRKTIKVEYEYFSVHILARFVANRGLLYRPVQSLKQIFKTYDVNLSCETSHQEKNT